MRLNEAPATTRAWTALLLHPAFPAACIVSGLLARGLLALLAPVEPMSDFAWYLARAADLAAGKGYQEGGQPTAYWPVGWPAILSAGLRLSLPPTLVVVLLNLAASLATMLLILWFARQVLHSELAGRLALLGYAVYPNHVAYVPSAANEVVYTALAMAALAALVRRDLALRAAVGAGVLFGIATLIKPQTVLFPAGVLAVMLVMRGWSDWGRVLRHGVVAYLSLLIVVLPWSARNQAVFGEFVMVSTNGGVALLLGANDEMNGSHFPIEESAVWKRIGVPASERVARQLELSKLQKAEAVRWIQANPGEYLAWMPKKVFLLWYKDTDGFWSYDHTYPRATIAIRGAQIVNQVGYLIVLGLALPALLRAVRTLARRGGDGDGDGLSIVFCMPLFVTALAAVFTGQIRYHYPAMPFLFLAAAWTAVRWMRAAPSASTPRTP